MNNFFVHRSKKFIFGATLSLLFAISCLSIFYIQGETVVEEEKEQAPKGPKPVVLLLPHQDDEMAMAGTAYYYLKQGHPVYSLLITDGSGSMARHVINGHTPDGQRMFSVVKKQFLVPEHYGYHDLTKQDFSAARNREYVASMLNLGLEPANIRISNPGGIKGSEQPIYKDGGTSPADAYRAINEIYQEVGDGIYLTRTSIKGEGDYLNVDHRAIEVALKAFQGISTKYYFSDKENPAFAFPLTPEELEIKKQMMDQYRVWDPKHGRFAIGEHSVKFMLDFWSKNPYEYILPDPHNR